MIAAKEAYLEAETTRGWRIQIASAKAICYLLFALK